MSERVAVRLGREIRAQRKRLGLTQKEVVESLGHSQTWLSYVESGNIEPAFDDLDALLRRLDMSLTVRVNRGKEAKP